MERENASRPALKSSAGSWASEPASSNRSASLPLLASTRHKYWREPYISEDPSAVHVIPYGSEYCCIDRGSPEGTPPTVTPVTLRAQLGAAESPVQERKASDRPSSA